MNDPCDYLKELVDVLQGLMKKTVVNYRRGRNYEVGEHGLDLWYQAYQTMKTKGETLRTALETEFRKQVTIPGYTQDNN